MAQDLRELFKKEKDKKFPMKSGHEERFLERLDSALPQKKKASYFFLKVAASFIVLISLGVFTYYQTIFDKDIPETVVDRNEVQKSTEKPELSLGDLSPDLRKVENYYVANINLELSQLQISEDNKAVVDGFMERLAALNEEYQVLNKELNDIGPNDQTITALVRNLQLRLQLLLKLKEKLNELKSSKNEEFTTNI
ncbi:hypothetical protein [Poritiphilus flavus]|uniref:Anti-sigma factor n=1 Tax=Poritiphilus flavus TaxID=2697053 RepID=A0A6L9E962_9FLAO|nr:hypothetical protein [Poritiphilus flavus]NAS11305.1 hypothetical protein [Poritiphilus flavus]